MRLPTPALILPAAAMMFAFSPAAQATSLASAGLHAQAGKLVHPVAQKKMKSKSATNKPKAKGKTKNY